ncbi:MAG TPA: phosphatase PAP2 family protein, partial [Mycobacteriales bacterium]|nr:phosphatase PAP2 family protein [Mycobacteriales bacterium]
MWWRELALGLSVFGLYIMVAAVSRPRIGTAREHGRAVLAFENWLGLDFEAAANSWLARQPTFWQNLVNYEYAFGYVLVAFLVLFWIGLRRPAAFGAARTSFVLVNLVGIGCFLLFPVAPPRLLEDPRFVDTVLQGHTTGSWGSALVSEANQVAAMPSLHVAWALWACVALVEVGARRRSHVFSAAHVVVTAIVIVVTANHYWLDAVAGVALVWLVGRRRPGARRVPAEDAFFLHVESARVPQHVGGVAIFDAGGLPAPVRRDDLVTVVAARLLPQPAFRRVLEPPGRMARPRWGRATDVDLDWHVGETVLPAPGGEPALRRFIASAAETPLPRDRPLWRIWLVHGVGPDRQALVAVLHHALGDGTGLVAHLRELFTPPPTPAGPLRTSGAPGAV